MDLNDTARVVRPRDPVELRLGTVTDTFDNGCTTYIQRYRLRFPNGEERTYRPAEVIACTRDDDRAAITACVTAACRSLRDACRRAHDHDDALSADITSLLARLVNTAQHRLGISLDPTSLDEPADADQVTP